MNRVIWILMKVDRENLTSKKLFVADNNEVQVYTCLAEARSAVQSMKEAALKTEQVIFIEKEVCIPDLLIPESGGLTAYM